jgi:hypothetical protein
MILPAETIYQALFNYVCGIGAPLPGGKPSLTPLVTKSRRWMKWDQLGDIPMPAFFQMQPPQGVNVSQSKIFGPSRYKLHADLWFYLPVDSGNLNTPTSPQLNNYFAAIDALFQPQLQSPGGARQQLGLGPSIEQCWIDGTVIFDEGLVTPPAVLLVPISIVCG